jgi:hypothetical protein
MFEKAYIFREYVDYFYKIKKNTPKSDCMYLISKLFLNSLYGKFGMSPRMLAHKVIDGKDYEDFISTYICTNFIDLNNGKLLLTYDPIKPTDDPNDVKPPKVSVAIASAITGYSRIIMTPYIMNYQNTIHAIDTDGVKYSDKIDNHLIGKELGQMEHEGTYSDAVFIAPKTYGLFNKDSIPVVKVKGLKNPVSF